MEPSEDPCPLDGPAVLHTEDGDDLLPLLLPRGHGSPELPLRDAGEAPDSLGVRHGGLQGGEAAGAGSHQEIPAVREQSKAGAAGGLDSQLSPVVTHEVAADDCVLLTVGWSPPGAGLSHQAWTGDNKVYFPPV